MGARREITKKYVRQHAVAGKKDKGRMFGELCGARGRPGRTPFGRWLWCAPARGPARAVVRKPRELGEIEILKISLNGEPVKSSTTLTKTARETRLVAGVKRTVA